MVSGAIFDPLKDEIKQQLQMTLLGGPALLILIGIVLIAAGQQSDDDIVHLIVALCGGLFIAGGVIALCPCMIVYCRCVSMVEKAVDSIKDDFTAMLVNI